VLTGRDRSPEYARLSAGDQRAILEILLATKAGLPGPVIIVGERGIPS
jgi:hypothetical protein